MVHHPGPVVMLPCFIHLHSVQSCQQCECHHPHKNCWVDQPRNCLLLKSGDVSCGMISQAYTLICIPSIMKLFIISATSIKAFSHPNLGLQLVDMSLTIQSWRFDPHDLWIHVDPIPSPSRSTPNFANRSEYNLRFADPIYLSCKQDLSIESNLI